MALPLTAFACGAPAVHPSGGRKGASPHHPPPIHSAEEGVTWARAYMPAGWFPMLRRKSGAAQGAGYAVAHNKL